MTLEEAIYGRRSIRKFNDKEVSDESIRTLIDAAIQAPSACNLQGWKFLVVRKSDRKIFHNEILSHAPAIILVTYKNDAVSTTGTSHKDYVQSAAAAIENMLLMAYSKGIGACWICDIPDSTVLQLHFHIPNNYEVLAAVALGYCDENTNTSAQKLFHETTEEKFDLHRRKYTVEECTYFETYKKNYRDKEQLRECSKHNVVRDYWVKCMLKVADPVLRNCAEGTLHKNMPLFGRNIKITKNYAHLEALSRTILGISPWLENDSITSVEEKRQKQKYRDWARKSIANAVNPMSPDCMNWNKGDQPLVDAAFLCLGILQAKEQLWNNLDKVVQQNFVQAIKQTRVILPWRSNWILFSAMIEVFIYEMVDKESCIKSVIDYAVSQFEQWYVGDGFYKDGDNFHFDYYESIVIHPFLLEIVRYIPWINDSKKYMERALRYSKILLTFIGDDGCYPAIGRSLCYRGGVLHILSKLAAFGAFESNCEIDSKSVRTSLTNVLNRIMSDKIFDANGWLKIGLVQEQSNLAEPYINTGSLYMFMAMFMITAIDSQNNFWQEGKIRDYSGRIWSGENLIADSSQEGWKKM